MDIRHITDDFAVTAQLTIKDVSLAKAMGFNSIICNRPDGEEEQQELFEAVKSAAKRSDMPARYIPVAPSGPTAADAESFAAAYAELPKPILAYCRSGGRAQATYMMSGVANSDGKVA